MKGSSEPQTGFYRTFRIEPPHFSAYLFETFSTFSDILVRSAWERRNMHIIQHRKSSLKITFLGRIFLRISWDIRGPHVGISLTLALGCPRQKLHALGAFFCCFRQGNQYAFHSRYRYKRKLFCYAFVVADAETAVLCSSEGAAKNR